MTRSSWIKGAALIGVALAALGAGAPWAEEAVPGLSSPALVLSEAIALAPAGGRNPTVAVDRRTGAAYLAWAQEVAGAAPQAPAKKGMKPDPKLEVLLARSDDGGRHFGTPIVVNAPKDNVQSHTVSPTQAAVGPNGEVYVLYSSEDPDFALLGMRLRHLLWLARSEDGGRSFAPPIEIGSESVEGVATSHGMTNLFVAPDGSLYASWLDTRETFAYVLAHNEWPPKQVYSSQLRVARSADGGRSFAQSTLAAKPVCVCCGTKVAQGTEGPLYASTRGVAWSQVKGSADAVRDIVVAASRDHGATWSEAIKIHDDRFKVSGCPDVAPGLSVDSKGRLHAAWYTGTERHPGIFYAVSTDQGRSFSEPVALLVDEWVPYADVKLALDAQDNAWVAFEDRRGDEDLIHLVRIDSDGQIRRAVPWPGTIPDLATIGDSAVVVWGSLPPGDGEEPQGGGVKALIARAGTGS
jgi:nucleotide-binding universal stress UspA family protein